MSSGVADVEDSVASSCRAVGERVDIGDVELDSVEFDELVEKDIDQVPMTECADMATAQSTTLQESANHSEV
jgi:hypothetical protein